MKSVSTIKEIHHFKYFTGSHPKVIEQYRKGNRPKEFGNKIWATSLILLEHLHLRQTDLTQLRVLEIGCGWGILGVYLAQEFCCNVTCSDLDENVLPIVDLLANLNQVCVTTKCASFNDLSAEYLKNFDVIIGAEVCYSTEVAHDLVALIERAKRARVKHIFIGDPGRPDFNDFVNQISGEKNSNVTLLPGSINGKETKLLHLSLS